MKSLRVLICAYACEPHRGSEPGVGWSVARHIAEHCETWVITREAFRQAIEAELANNPVSQLHFVYYDPPPWLKAEGVIRSHVHYYLWQIGTYPVARRLCRNIDFDLTHHVTYARYWGPSFLALLPLPFIWGPVGGGESAPKGFWRGLGLGGVLFEVQREMARWLGEHDPYTRRTARRSTLALATTAESAARMRKLKARSVRVLSEAGLPQEDIKQLRLYPLDGESPVRFISTGRLLGWKGFHLGLCAFAEARLTDAEYWIVGDGPERRSLEILAKRLGVDHKARFWGHLPRKEALSKLQRCHVVVHPSLHDSGGWVCLEAMAAGRPVVCLDIGGPATQVTPEAGFKIAARNSRQTVVDLAEAIKKLAGSQELRKRMGEAGRELVMQEFSWSRKAEKMSGLYDLVLGEQRTSRRSGEFS